ncbi:DUF1272 domain-containing protein [Sphingomonas sp. 1P06PA]|uniref:DUF1272 domain-containing protein n=1 Tax=Sphingomonas sp. 1P06PA TaxID=554121 RepID=UPI0039A718C8
MLEMKPHCERCEVPVAPDMDGAFICSFECTFCRDCAEGPLAMRCPNCAGPLAQRPMRCGEALRRAPAAREARG